MLKGKLNINLEALEGLFKPKTPPLIGTDISSSAIKMVEIAEASKGVYRVERYAVEPLPKESVVDGNINNLDAVSEALKRCHKHQENPCSRRPARGGPRVTGRNGSQPIHPVCAGRSQSGFSRSGGGPEQS